MILSDHSIREAIEAGRILIDPYHDQNVQPCSYDVSLGEDFLVQPYKATVSPYRSTPIDPRIPNAAELEHRHVDIETVIEPGVFMLGTTIETIGLPNDIAARIEGKSSLARLGLVIHQTAGFIDAGFVGQITLELVNVALRPILLYPGMKIGQISFIELTTPADRPYGSPGLNSKYQNQDGPTESAYHGNVTSDMLAQRFSNAMQWRPQPASE